MSIRRRKTVCKQCNFFTLLDEIKGVFEMELMKKPDIRIDSCHRTRKLLTEPIMEMFNHSAYKVCKSHMEGKR